MVAQVVVVVHMTASSLPSSYGCGCRGSESSAVLRVHKIYDAVRCELLHLSSRTSSTYSVHLSARHDRSVL